MNSSKQTPLKKNRRKKDKENSSIHSMESVLF